ncbi:MAG: hypothetical protein H8E18_11460 [FCB group bacterium]|nr:hypothetical protein [FCB group bacterium]
MIIVVGLLVLTFLSPDLYAQEEDLFGDSEGDSLLFGDEFDLGGDDFSFETEDEAETDTEASGEDDFFGEFGDEETVDETEAEVDSAEVDEWGLGTDSDYESLITRTADGNVLEEVPDHPLDLGKYVEGTIFEDTGFTFSIYSPQMVPDKLNTWYSFMDVSLTTELPWHFTFEPVELSFSIDISSFKFVNSFPAGGEFKGFSIMPMARAEMYGAEIEVGMGMFTPTFGAIAGIGYTYQFHSLFFSAGYRWNWAYNIDPIGSSWWLEPRITTGVKFW